MESYWLQHGLCQVLHPMLYVLSIIYPWYTQLHQQPAYWRARLLAIRCNRHFAFVISRRFIFQTRRPSLTAADLPLLCVADLLAQDRRNATHSSLPADHGNLATRQIASVQHTSREQRFGSCAAVALIAA